MFIKETLLLTYFLNYSCYKISEWTAFDWFSVQPFLCLEEYVYMY